MEKSTVIAHVFLKNRKVAYPAMLNVPRVGDTLRLSDTVYVRVTEVIWCLDENDILGRDRVNIRTEELA